MTKNVTVQDVIQQEPATVISLDPTVYGKCCFNKNLYPVIEILKSGPKTVTEISKLYPVKKSSETEELKKKSENTIYRYIKELIDTGVVIEAGRRIETGKVSTKILYSLSARLILIEDPSVRIWNSEQSQSLAKTLGLLLNHNFDGKLPSIDPFIETISQFVQDRAAKRDELLKAITEPFEVERSGQKGVDSSTGAFEAIAALNAEEYYQFLFRLGNILWLLATEDFESIKRDISSVFTEEIDDGASQPASLERKKQDGGYQDVITYKQAIIKLVGIEDWEKYLTAEKYRAITFLLRERPMTIKEIAENHQSALIKVSEERKKEYEAKNKEFKTKIPKTPYKENTIYRYVQDLIDAGFLVEAGQRIIPNQTSTQHLYARTAKVFYTLGYSSGSSKDRQVNNTDLAIGHALKHHLNKQQFDPDKLHGVLSGLELEVREALEKSLLGATDGRIVNLIFSFSGYELETLMDALGNFEWLINSEQEKVKSLKNSLLDCFS